MKRLLSVVLTVVMMLSMVPCAYAAGSRDVSYEETLAADLKELGLFKGVSETNFNLGRAPSRLEAIVMLVRVLGKEQEALNGTWKHPFTDVPKWADQYVGFAYENGLANGVTPTTFGTTDSDAKTYLTFVLRALGYSDKNGEDFTWSSPYALASEVGILSDYVDLDNFWRADVVLVSYAALPVALKDSDQTLAEKLIAAGAFTREQFNKSFDPDFLKNAPKDQSGQDKPSQSGGADKKLSAQEIAEKCSDAVFSITTYAFNGSVKSTGSGFFISSDGLAITNRHVIANSSTISITLADGEVYNDVIMTSSDSTVDLALLRINGTGFSYLELGDSAALKQGQRVYAIGSPKGLSNTMSEGIVSNVKRVVDGTEYVQISVPIAPGSSGGALLDEYGRVVGVTTAGYTDASADLNLAVGSNYISQLDHADTTSYVCWDNQYYTNFSRAVDFGAFTGMKLAKYQWFPYGLICAYDIFDFYESPIRDDDANYSYSLIYYNRALLNEGFVIENGAKAFEDWYVTDTEYVYVDISLEDPYIYIIAQWAIQYYEECAVLPDLGWYLGLDPVVDGKKDDSWTYMYEWKSDYTEENFLFWFNLYLELLKEEGFKLVYQEPDTFLYEGNGWSIVINNSNEKGIAFVDAKPLG